MRIHRPGQRQIALGAEFAAGHEHDVGGLWRVTPAPHDRADRRDRSTPAFSSPLAHPFSLKRATPITRLAGAARLAMRASVGPILPPTPSTMVSPGVFAERSAISASDGVVMNSSRASDDLEARGQLRCHWMRSFGAAGMARSALKSTSAPTAKPAQPSDVRLIFPSFTLRRAGLPAHCRTVSDA